MGACLIKMFGDICFKCLPTASSGLLLDFLIKLAQDRQHVQYWTGRIGQNRSVWSKTTLITDGVGGAGVDPPS